MSFFVRVFGFYSTFWGFSRVFYIFPPGPSGAGSAPHTSCSVLFCLKFRVFSSSAVCSPFERGDSAEEAPHQCQTRNNGRLVGSINLQQQRTAPRSDWRLDRRPTGDSPPNEFLINTAEPSDHRSTSNACVLWSVDVLDVKSRLYCDSLKVLVGFFVLFLLLMCVKSDSKHTNKQSGRFGNKPRKFTHPKI